MVPEAGVWTGFASKTPTPKLIVVSSPYETSDLPETKFQAPMKAHHYKAAYWVGQGVFDGLTSFMEFEARVNDIFEEKDRGDVFEIFIEGYLATQTITQHLKHWVVGGIPVDMRERFNLPNDGTGTDGIYEERDGSQYRRYHAFAHWRTYKAFADLICHFAPPLLREMMWSTSNWVSACEAPQSSHLPLR